jgi:hypothetical protein
MASFCLEEVKREPDEKRGWGKKGVGVNSLWTINDASVIATQISPVISPGLMSSTPALIYAAPLTLWFPSGSTTLRPKLSSDTVQDSTCTWLGIYGRYSLNDHGQWSLSRWCTLDSSTSALNLIIFCGWRMGTTNFRRLFTTNHGEMDPFFHSFDDIAIQDIMQRHIPRKRWNAEEYANDIGLWMGIMRRILFYVATRRDHCKPCEPLSNCETRLILE